jgi:hypothetical protein
MHTYEFVYQMDNGCARSVTDEKFVMSNINALLPFAIYKIVDPRTRTHVLDVHTVDGFSRWQLSVKFLYRYTCETVKFTTDSFAEVEALSDDCFPITVQHRDKDVTFLTINNEEELQLWREKLERDWAWRPDSAMVQQAPTTGGKISNAVDPAHYKGYIKDMQWIEAVGHMPNFKNTADGRFYAAIEMQARKYLDRLGKKDAGVQEVLKAVWYLNYLAACMHEGRAVRVEEVKDILAKL